MHLRKESALRYAIFTMGFTALVTQIIVLREALNIFQGNELVIGIVLSNWMMLTGIGAFLGKYNTRYQNQLLNIGLIQLVVAFLPAITVATMYLISSVFIRPGIMLSPGEIWLLSFVVLIPFCLLSGTLFTLFSIALKSCPGKFSIGTVYGIEALGSIAGGLIFSLLLIHLIDTFHSLFILFWINVAAVLLLSITGDHKPLKIVAVSMAVLAIPVVMLVNIDEEIIKTRYPGQEIELWQETPYGKIVVTRAGRQINFYENGSLNFSSEQVEKSEETVHFAMAQHPDPVNVLLVSGGISGTIKELSKYKDIQIDYLEINPAWARIGQQFTDAFSSRDVNMIIVDARKYIHDTEHKYDVVIIDLPSPVTAQVNRYYTYEFFNDIKNVMNSNGILSVQLPSSANYMSDELVQSHSSLINTQKLLFGNVIIFPGIKDYFIASDAFLTFEILDRLMESEIENIYLNPYYYIPELSRMRYEKIAEVLDTSIKVNYDFRPTSYFIQLQYWLSHFKYNYWIIVTVYLLLGILVFIPSNKTNKALFISGFTGSSMVIILLISFQVLYGNIYYMSGFILTSFMCGLAVGSLIIPKIISPGRTRYILTQLSIGIFVIIVPLSIQYLSVNTVSDTLIIFTINLLCLFAGVLIGFQYKQASYMQESTVAKAAASTYAVDLIGSTIGSLASALVMIPLIGLIETCFIIAGINLLASFFLIGIRIKV